MGWTSWSSPACAKTPACSTCLVRMRTATVSTARITFAWQSGPGIRKVGSRSPIPAVTSRSFGNEVWQQNTAKQLGLEFTLRPPRATAKETMSVPGNQRNGTYPPFRSPFPLRWPFR